MALPDWRRYPGVLRLADLQYSALEALLDQYALRLVRVADGENIPGSYWGAPEAGLIGNRLYARPDTPLHSVLHETAHFICMDRARRKILNTDAGGDYAEENGVCYLQILLADRPGMMGRERMFADMDHWGYRFRFGSAKRWFYDDGGDAAMWLQRHGLIERGHGPVIGRCR